MLVFFPFFAAYISQRALYNLFKVEHLTDVLDESLATRRSSRIRSVTPNASAAVNSGSEDSQEATTPISKEKLKSTGTKITSYSSPKQRAAAAASAAVDSDNSNISQKYLHLIECFLIVERVPKTFLSSATALKTKPSQRNNHNKNPYLNVVDGHLVTQRLKRMKKK
jgi:hypothetical protein